MIGKETYVESIRIGDTKIVDPKGDTRGSIKLEPEEWKALYENKHWAWFIGHITSHITQMITDQSCKDFIKRYSK